MMRAGMRLYLASTSPRRRALLSALGVDFVVVAPGPEIAGTGSPCERALLRAASKAASGDLAGREPGIVLGVDTIVAIGDVEYDQPKDAEQARATLRSLQGRTHDVWTAHCLRRHPGGGITTELAHARVRFAPLDDARIERHVGGGRWAGKAGGYGIQDECVDFATLVAGDLDTVIGLSRAALDRLFESSGLERSP
ncbi:MAG: Maf-like protein [Planctomycetes bacterium]|nr:Maf-like protein [Planctomycetota bacterium]